MGVINQTFHLWYLTTIMLYSAHLRLLNSKKNKAETKTHSYHDASKDTSSTPLCNIGLNRRVKGNGTLAVKRKEAVTHRFP